jgi:hypothetical protein
MIGIDRHPNLPGGAAMRRMRFITAGLLTAGAFIGPALSPASAGLFGCGKKQCCQDEYCRGHDKCCKPKRHCCLCPPEAPEAEIGFAQPGVIRPGQAVPVREASLRRAIQEAAVLDLKRETEAAPLDATSEGRLKTLEENVEQITSRLDRLTRAVEALAEKQISTGK